MTVISLFVNFSNIPSVIKDNENGILFKAGDIPKMKEAILTVSRKNNFLVMSDNARKTAEEKYAIDLLYSKFLKIYKCLGDDDKWGKK